MEMTQSLREAEFNPADVWTQHATRAVFFIGGFGAASWGLLHVMICAATLFHI